MAGEGVELALVGVVDVHGLDHARDLADPLRQVADLAHPGVAQAVDPALQLRDQPGLRRIEGDRGEAHGHVLGEDEAECRDQEAALERGRDDRIAEVAAERLDLAGHHRDQLALGDPAEVAEREAQHARQQLRAQQAQQALAEPALVDVDRVFEAAVDQDRQQEQAGQEGEVLELRVAAEVDAAEGDGARKIGRLAAERLVDDLLGQVERGVVDRQRGGGQQQQHDLLRQAEAGEEAERGARQIVARARAEAAEKPTPRARGWRCRGDRHRRRGTPARLIV